MRPRADAPQPEPSIDPGDMIYSSRIGTIPVMSRSVVQEILQKIDALPQKDRQRLERELAARNETEWKRLAKQARTQARRRGVDQAAIDRAIERTRYGPA
jgi:hypothetical protein